MTTIIQVEFLESDNQSLFGPSMYKTLVKALWNAGAPGVTVFRGEEGLDHQRRIQNIHSDYLSDSLPIKLHVVIDSDEDVQSVIQSIGQATGDKAFVFLMKGTNIRDILDSTRRESMPVPRMSNETPGSDTESRQHHIAKVIRVYMKEDDSYDGKPLHHVLLEQLQKESSVAWVGVQQALEGFGKEHVIRKNQLFSMSTQAPLVLEVTCRGDEVHTLLNQLEPYLLKASGPCVVLEGQQVQFKS